MIINFLIVIARGEKRKRSGHVLYYSIRDVKAEAGSESGGSG